MTKMFELRKWPPWYVAAGVGLAFALGLFYGDPKSLSLTMSAIRLVGLWLSGALTYAIAWRLFAKLIRMAPPNSFH